MVDGVVPVDHSHHRVYHRLRGAAAMTDIVERLCDGEHCTVGCAKLRAEAAAEIERLTAREEQRAERLRLYMNRIGELEADNERLQAALQEIADFPYVGAQASQKIWGIARRALEPKP